MAAFTIVDANDPCLAPSTRLADARSAVQQAWLLSGVQAAMRDNVLSFLDDHPNALERTCTEGHLTGSAFVVDPSRARAVLLLHAKLGLWLQPGGHADGDANLAGVAVREAREETGIDDLQVVLPAIDVDIHEVRPPGEPPHLHLDVRYLVLAPPSATLVSNHESRELRWVDTDELAELVSDASTRRLARCAFAALRLLEADRAGRRGSGSSTDR